MKRIKRLIALGVLAIVVLIVVAVLWIDRVAKAGVEKGSTYALGVPTALDSADIGILTGRSGLNGLTVSNPAGFESPHFLHLGEGVLAVSLGTLTQDTVELSEFSLTGIDMNLEKRGGKANYQVITDNLKRFESGDAKSTEDKAADKGKKFIIRKIVVKDVTVHVNLMPIGGDLTKLTVPIEELQLENVGSESDKGVVVAQVVNTLVKAILMAAIEKGGGVIPNEILGELNGAMQQLESLAAMGTTLAVSVEGTLKDLSSQVGDTAKALGETAKELGDTTKETGDKLKESLGGLLKKKDDEK